MNFKTLVNGAVLFIGLGQQPNFSDKQSFTGDKAYIGANRTTTPKKKPPKRELTRLAKRVK